MKKSKTKKLIAFILIASGVFVSLSFAFISVTEKGKAKKKVLAILGDAHHSVFPQYSAIVGQLQDVPHVNAVRLRSPSKPDADGSTTTSLELASTLSPELDRGSPRTAKGR